MGEGGIGPFGPSGSYITDYKISKCEYFLWNQFHLLKMIRLYLLLTNSSIIIQDISYCQIFPKKGQEKLNWIPAKLEWLEGEE